MRNMGIFMKELIGQNWEHYMKKEICLLSTQWHALYVFNVQPRPLEVWRTIQEAYTEIFASRLPREELCLN